MSLANMPLEDVLMEFARLRTLLESQGFHCETNHLRHAENPILWSAYRRSSIPARPCECNSDKPGMQIAINPSVVIMDGNRIHRSVEVELVGEADGVWWKMSAYSLNPDEVEARLPGIEKSLIAAWNVLNSGE